MAKDYCFSLRLRGFAVDVDHARGVDGLAVVHRAVATDAVVVLEGIAERIHQQVTALGALVLIIC